MKTRKFQRTKEDFTCEQCGGLILGETSAISKKEDKEAVIELGE